MSTRSFIVLSTAAALFAATPRAQAQDVEGAGMLLYTHATTIEYDGNSVSGGAFSVAGDLLIAERWVGRAQFDVLSAASLSGDGADNVNSGFAFVGSLGYRLRFASLPAFSLDLLGHAGYAQVNYEGGGSDFTDASPQVGAGIAPHLSLSDRLGVTLSIRVLQGADVGEGTAIHRTDIGIGGRLRLF